MKKIQTVEEFIIEAGMFGYKIVKEGEEYIQIEKCNHCGKEFRNTLGLSNLNNSVRLEIYCPECRYTGEEKA